MENSSQAFWNWFQENHQTYRKLLSDSSNLELGEELETLMNNFQEQLGQHHPHLGFRMGGKYPELELIITAEGVLEHFPAVIELVNQAPQIEQWKIIRFLPGNDELKEFSYKMPDFELTQEDIFFAYTKKNLEAENPYLEVIFYVKDEKFVDHSEFKNSIRRIAETLVGEFNFALLVDPLDVRPYSHMEAEHKKNHLAIYQFPELIDDFIKEIKRED